MAKIVVSNLSQMELEGKEKINRIGKAIKEAILSMVGLELREKDISVSFPASVKEEAKKVSVTIAEKALFGGEMNFWLRQILCLRVKNALEPILQRDGKDISVEIKRPK